ncbi:MAG TPA: 3'-5' exonuclease [Candidatus Dormibacteraeota bacterium]|nr:3'-5' exonuclease [Candidatus Dormibacteraeota bacterium]
MSAWLNRGERTGEGSNSTPLDSSIESLRYVVIDTELTSLQHRTNRLLSVGAIAMRGPSIQLGEQFYRVVNPECAIPAEGIVIHQLRSEDLQAAQQLSTTLDDLGRFLVGAVLVGHFADIDMKILRKEMSQTGHKLGNPAVCTARIHQWILRQGPYSEDLPMRLEQLDLPTLAKFYGLNPQNAHHALSDAFQTAQLWQKMLFTLRSKGIDNLSRLLKIGGV